MLWVLSVGAERAAPRAVVISACGSTIRSSSRRPITRTNAARSAGRKVSGPPVHSTGFTNSAPRARVVIVCMATAWKMLAEMSARGRRRLTRFWMSVLAKTPQRDAMG